MRLRGEDPVVVTARRYHERDMREAFALDKLGLGGLVTSEIFRDLMHHALRVNGRVGLFGLEQVGYVEDGERDVHENAVALQARFETQQAWREDRYEYMGASSEQQLAYVI